MRKTSFEIPPDSPRVALDAALRAKLELSWGQARALVSTGKVRVAGVVVTEPTRHVRPGARIDVDPTAPQPGQLALERERLVLVDSQVVVVDKPTGISTIPFDPGGMARSLAKKRGPGDEVTLDARVRAALKKRGTGSAQPNLGVVHRLDKETTGLLVFARTFVAKKLLSSQFRAHSITREYLAIVHGAPRSGTIRSHLVDDRGDGIRGSVERTPRRVPRPDAQLAVTHVEVLERLDGASFVRCTLETGRTHQIRVHLAEAGSPILGERVYVRGYRGTLLEAPRVMLHAARLGFDHPSTGERVELESPLPGDFTELLEALRRASP